MASSMNRREWNRLVLTATAGFFVPSALVSCATSSAVPPALKGTPAAAQAKDLGIVLGAQTYSFRDRSLDEAIKAMQTLGIRSCELWEGHVEPRNLQWAAGQTATQARSKNDAIVEWRKNLDYGTITAIRKKMDAAGIAIVAYTATIKQAISDHDLEVAFKIAQALGVDTINSSAQVSVMKRIDAFAQKYKTRVAMHNHSHTDQPNEISSPESFTKGMEGCSDYICINLDIGHFTAANFDAVAFLRNNHQKVLSIHVKDRKKDQGLNMPFGQGETPIREVLHLIRDNKWPIPANIEYEYKGEDTMQEMAKCLDYCKLALKA